MNIAALARTVSGLAKAETEHRKWAERARAGVAAVEKKVEEARTKGLSKDAADQIRSSVDGDLAVRAQSLNQIRLNTLSLSEERVRERCHARLRHYYLNCIAGYALARESFARSG